MLLHHYALTIVCKVQNGSKYLIDKLYERGNIIVIASEKGTRNKINFLAVPASFFNALALMTNRNVHGKTFIFIFLPLNLL
jgi:hypothetical protein